MTGHLAAAVAVTGHADFERAAGCCTALPEHRRAAATVARRVRLRRRLRGNVRSESLVCC